MMSERGNPAEPVRPAGAGDPDAKRNATPGPGPTPAGQADPPARSAAAPVVAGRMRVTGTALTGTAPTAADSTGTAPTAVAPTGTDPTAADPTAAAPTAAAPTAADPTAMAQRAAGHDPGGSPGAAEPGAADPTAAELTAAAFGEDGHLLTEGVLGKFLRYVRIDTQSDPSGERVPTTLGQWTLAKRLQSELETIGMQDVEMDAYGIVTATLPPTPGCEGAATFGLLAHVDTSPAVSGRSVNPIVHGDYDGRPLRLPKGPVLDVGELAERVTGHDIVTSDGSTLLGADDKAGVAEIMEALCRMIASDREGGRDPGAPAPFPHGRIRVAFTTDEETGRGIDHLDIARFGAEAAYTLDGSVAGEIEAENFNAENLRVRIEGRSAHPGSARGHMVNAVHLAALFVAGLPLGERPETTEGREGFYHVDEVRGDVDAVEVTLILRDFSKEGLARRRGVVDRMLQALAATHPGARTAVEVTGGYENMATYLEAHPQVVRRALDATRAAGLDPKPHAIRGGTDGAKLTARGLPTPNIFTGGAGFHSRTEWASVQWMEQAVQVVLHLARLWATEA